MSKSTVSIFLLAAAFLSAPGIGLSQQDTFESGTTEGWFAGGGPFGASPPGSPINVPTGGPAGVDDNYLLITSHGQGGGAPSPGNRPVGMNGTQWAQDYLANGIAGIGMFANNFGPSDLFLRLLFENPFPGPATDIAFSTDAIFLVAASGWQHIFFPTRPTDLTALAGTTTAALSTTTILRIYHSETAGFPGPPTAAALGLDNITAAPVVPEPVSMILLGTGLLGVGATAYRRRKKEAELV